MFAGRFFLRSFHTDKELEPVQKAAPVFAAAMPKLAANA
jgi:hypothetical protein